MELRAKPVFQWVINAVILDHLIITKPFTKAILLSRYHEPAKSPMLKGKAAITEILSKLSPGTKIPEDLFKAVAKVLAFCYNINKDFRLKIDNM